jgi:D-lactate dehydrogenase (cytochrome)
MATWVLQGRPPRGDWSTPQRIDDPDLLRPYLEDAAHFPGGVAAALYAPVTEREVASILQSNRAVLPIGAQSSLTGGATPVGGALLSTRRFNRVGPVASDRVAVGAGVTLTQLDEVLAAAGAYYPPGPTFTGAFVGGTVATNASGAATFKYGSTRDWVQALTVVLAGGDVLDIERGVTRAHPDGYFDLELPTRTPRVPVPSYRMPAVRKLSAGYFAEPEMDLIDLFIGSEGTLGVITEVTLRLLPVRPSFCLAFVPFARRESGLSFVRHVRNVSLDTRRTGNPRALDASAIEHIDARCVALVREDGVDTRFGVTLPRDTELALLVTIELPPGVTQTQAFDELGAGEASPSRTPLAEFATLLARHTEIDRVQLALPGQQARAQQLLAVREAVPLAVNQRVGATQRTIDQRIEKVAADAVVPFDRFEEFERCCAEQFGRRGLDVAVWGHISDGNTHPNLIPRSFEDVALGRQAVLAVSREAIRLGGAPLAEHGVGRNRVKQQLVVDLYGERGVEDMRRVKSVLDPDWKLAPGVLFDQARPLCEEHSGTNGGKTADDEPWRGRGQ